LVLADKGIAAVDEMDKMDNEDKSALHEAMEQQTISVAKAGVMATLKSRCSLLAAANPKQGRFDKYEPIAPQINLTPALMSRFDLIFVLTDDPDRTRDSRIAEHILQSNYAGELSIQTAKSSGITKEDVQAALEIIQPGIKPDLLRKYVAYARKNVFPVITEEVKERLKGYYVSLRGQGQDTNKPVPVTARQLEALVRLSEASARLRLSNRVVLEDAERAIRISYACLQKVGVDPETGFLDADIIATGISKATRDKTKLILEIIRDLSRDNPSGAPIGDVMDRAEKEGVDRSRAEDILARYRQDGTIYLHQNRFIRMVGK
jgi:replicative DNA helicase Mcm